MSNYEEPSSSHPAPRLTSLWDTLQTEGLSWILRRLRYRTPHSDWGRKIHACVRKIIGGVLYPKRALLQPLQPNLWDAHTLYAFYDLQVAPVTFDASWFAVAADRRRHQLGLPRLHFIIVPGTFHGFREERAHYETTIDTEARMWRLHNIVLPIFSLTRGFSGYSVLPSRPSVQWFFQGTPPIRYPEHYEPTLPVSHHPSELLKTTSPSPHQDTVSHLQSPAQGLRYLQRWANTRLRDRKLITITLRDYEFMRERNSNIRDWAAFAARLDQTRFLPVFILDTEGTLNPLPTELEGLEIFREASWNVPLRMALYELSELNLGVNNGPMFMCALNKQTRVLIFKLVTASVPQTTEALIASLGFEIGGQLPFATPYQKLVWEDDSLPVIEREFTAMMKIIEQNSIHSQHIS